MDEERVRKLLGDILTDDTSNFRIDKLGAFRCRYSST